MSINKVILLGRLTQDPAIRTFENGGKVAQFSLATNKRAYTTRDGRGRARLRFRRDCPDHHKDGGWRIFIPQICIFVAILGIVMLRIRNKLLYLHYNELSMTTINTIHLHHHILRKIG